MADSGQCDVCPAVATLSESTTNIKQLLYKCIDTLFNIIKSDPCGNCPKPTAPYQKWFNTFVMEIMKKRIDNIKQNTSTCVGCPEKLYCFKCKGFLCSNCSEIHTDNKNKYFMKEHFEKLFDFSETKLTLPTLCHLQGSPDCQEHEGKICILVCKDCKNKPVCVKCIVDKRHDTHSFQTVTKAAQNAKKYTMKEQIEHHCNEKKRMLEGSNNYKKKNALISALEKQKKYSQEKCQNYIERNGDKFILLHDMKEFISSLDHDWTYVQFIPRIDKRLDSMNTAGTYTCIVPDCTMCPRINDRTVIKGKIGCQEITEHFTCTSEGVVYIIQCTGCDRMYVGETGRSLRQRIHEHDSDIAIKCKLHRHFGEDECAGKPFSVTAVFKIENERNRKLVKTALMLKLGTLEPGKHDELDVSAYFDGLNERVSVEDFTEIPSAIDGLFILDRYIFLNLVEENHAQPLEE